MPAKNPFSKAQYELLFEAAKKARKKFKNQSDMALALELTQPSVSALLKKKWKPGISTAMHIAEAVGQRLEDLIGDFDASAEDAPPPPSSRMPNLETCVAFYAGEKSWSPWTIAAARAGLFGATDYAPPEWTRRLDALEGCASKFLKEYRG